MNMGMTLKAAKRLLTRIIKKTMVPSYLFSASKYRRVACLAAHS
jgi:hypothetical protein